MIENIKFSQLTLGDLERNMLQAGLHLLEQLGVGVQGVGGGWGGSLALEELSFSWDLNNVNNLDNILNSKRFASLK